MKSLKIISLVLGILILNTGKMFGQVKTYESQWKKVNELIHPKNLPKSALTEVKKIYALARAEKQEAQVIKSLVYITDLQSQLREDHYPQSIKEIEAEIKIAKEPAASILKSMLAGVYWEFLQNNRWKFYQRTNTVDFNKEDLNTWTLDDLHKKITELFLSSIKNEQLLKNTKIEAYESIIIKGNTRMLRPTLYDLLAHRALDYFSTDERDITKPAYAFEIIQPQAFAPAAQFASFRFGTKDSFSLQHKALLVYQDLIDFHLADVKPDALIDVDISRIEFVYQNSIAQDKDSLYLAALKTVANKHKDHPATKQAHYLIALWHERKASGYDPLRDSSSRYERIKAREILTAIVKDSSVKNEGWINSFNLLKSIEARSFSFEIEKVNLPGDPFRSLVSYRNISALNFRIIRADETLRKSLEANDETDKFWNILVAARPLRSWQQNLPATNDLQQHKTEIKIDSLPVGEYYLLASPDAQFEKKNSPLGARLFYVSNISYINHNTNFFVLHRESGQPLQNATASVYKQEYDYKTSKYKKTIKGTYKTDDKGYFKIAVDKENAYNNYFVDVVHGKDRLNLDESTYGYYYYDFERRQPRPSNNIFFFTDRSIYRPGQTVFFKGIAISSLDGKNTVLQNYSTTIHLVDANYQYIDSVKVTTNDFGSFKASFRLPLNTLNGNFQLVDKKNGVSDSYFSVEEYKRPKFYVEFEKIKTGYKAGDSVTVYGIAKAYAGNNIDGAKVSYRVVRQPRFIYTWFFSKWWMPPTKEMEIAHGEATTDKEGRFTVSFQAIPDKTIDIKYNPVFDYRIYADVTDINGETRSAENLVTAGYTSLILKLNTPERVAIDSFKTIGIRTENMNGEFQPSTLSVTITKLIPEQRLIRPRFWEQPDQFVMTKEQYIQLFPHDEYSNELDRKTWRKEEPIRISDSSRVKGEIETGNRKWQPGFYEIEVRTTDKDGKEVKDVRFIEIFDPASNQFNKPEYFWTKESGKAIEPGESAIVQLGSSANNIFMVEQVEKISPKVDDKPNTDKIRKPTEEDNTDASFRFHRINTEKKSFSHKAEEGDRGGFGVAYFFVRDNRFYQFFEKINVPWSNKDLQIEYSSFRDKTLPGSEEKWKIKIKGYKNEKVAAEILASMYDASLNQFRNHQWSQPNIWPYYDTHISWNSRLNFQAVPSHQKWINENSSRSFIKNYDILAFDMYTLIDPSVRRMGEMGFYSMKSRAVGNVAMDASMAESAPALQSRENVAYKDLLTTDTTAVADIKDKSQTGENNGPVQIRKNFNETAFFFPELSTDAEGNIEFSFTTPDALTRWKLQTLAHTKNLAFGVSQKEIITQKDLMVQPNMPRFLRQGDKMELSVKVVNLSQSELTGQAQLQLFDAATNQSVDGWFMNSFPNQYFTVAAGQSDVVKCPVQVPFQFSSTLVWRVVAKSGNFSDGEENMMPVLTNKVLVTETLPIPVRGSATKNFNFAKLLQSGGSPTLQHQALTVEYTSNPAWYAVQALPYLMEYPYDCAEQVWNRYYANALASKIASSTPRIKQIFERWKNFDTAALQSNLQKNQELKSALLEETPWVLQAKTEAEQKKNIALLFDMVRMSSEMEGNLGKLKEMQSSNGGFVWFKGGPDDRYITQYIITGIGHLKKLGVDTRDLDPVIKLAIPYLDRKIKEDYDRLVKSKADLKKQQIGYMQVQYLYMRSFFPGSAIAQGSIKAAEYYTQQAVQFWMKQNPYMQGMIALALSRKGNSSKIPAAILASLKESAINNEETGMYWKNQSFGYSWFWWYAPIETQALLIEAFHEISKDTETVDDLRTWLIKNKQTNNWRTTKATADAVYAVLVPGTDWISNEPVVEIKLGTTTFNNANQKTEAGTGYFKQSIEGQKVKPEMGNVRVSVQQTPVAGTKNSAPTWGAVYWQYFEDMDKVTSAETPLKLNKKLFIEKNTDRGPVLSPVNEGSVMKVGDKIKVRIELRVDRDMEYVHMKDMRASALEPVNVLSSYKWQGGLGYYESTKDASTNFFFNYLPKGTYVFEYALFVTHTGNFSNGITSIQCMYAPEFSAHSEGVRISVE